jgi:hypothetical protein
MISKSVQLFTLAAAVLLFGDRIFPSSQRWDERALQQERLAQNSRDDDRRPGSRPEPGGLPGRSDRSEDTTPSARGPSMRAAKPPTEKMPSQSKEKSQGGAKSDQSK